VKAVTKDVIVDFYREVADNSPIPIVIYSVRIRPYLFLSHCGNMRMLTVTV
jgi:dihydrodipicolinate synthase/N-acetylneuraminate lyase